MYTTLYFNFGIYYSMFNTKSQFLSFAFTHFVLANFSGKHYVSKCLFLFSWVCSFTLFEGFFFFLYPTYKWNHTIFVFLCLTYFGWCNILKVHLCHKWQDFTFYSWVIFHCVGLSVCVDKYRYTGITSSMSIHLSMGTWSVSISWLLWKKCC